MPVEEIASASLILERARRATRPEADRRYLRLGVILAVLCAIFGFKLFDVSLEIPEEHGLLYSLMPFVVGFFGGGLLHRMLCWLTLRRARWCRIVGWTALWLIGGAALAGFFGAMIGLLLLLATEWIPVPGVSSAAFLAAAAAAAAIAQWPARTRLPIGALCTTPILIFWIRRPVALVVSCLLVATLISFALGRYLVRRFGAAFDDPSAVPLPLNSAD